MHRQQRVRNVLIVAVVVALAGLPLVGSAAQARAPRCSEPAPTVCPPLFAHVWTIVLENSGLYTSFGLGQAAAPYMARTLPGEGALVPNYYGAGHSSLDNYIAMTSGQAPNSKTQGDCTDPSQLGGNDPTYHIDGSGQAIGTVGCTYRADVPNIASQLRSAHVSWKSYNESMDAHPGVQRTHCQGPDTYSGGVYQHTPDPYADPRTADQPHLDEYRAKHNPFVYYHDITDDLDYCDSHDVPLGAYGTDPNHPKTYDTLGTLRHDLRSEKQQAASSRATRRPPRLRLACPSRQVLA